MEALTRDELIAALTSRGEVPFDRAALEKMGDEELAYAANASGASFDELQRAAEGGRSGGGELAALRGTFGIAEEDRRRAANRATGELGFEPQAILSGPRGEAALDRSGDDRPASGEDRDELGFEVGPIMSGPRGSAVVDD